MVSWRGDCNDLIIFLWHPFRKMASGLKKASGKIFLGDLETHALVEDMLLDYLKQLSRIHIPCKYGVLSRPQNLVRKSSRFLWSGIISLKLGSTGSLNYFDTYFNSLIFLIVSINSQFAIYYLLSLVFCVAGGTTSAYSLSYLTLLCHWLEPFLLKSVMPCHSF